VSFGARLRGQSESTLRVVMVEATGSERTGEEEGVEEGGRGGGREQMTSEGPSL